MRIVVLVGMVVLLMFAAGCVECECTCRCTEGGTDYEDTFIVDEEADCDPECDTYTNETCPNYTAASFDVACE